MEEARKELLSALVQSNFSKDIDMVALDQLLALDSICLYVSDNGVYVSSDKNSKLFVAFDENGRLADAIATALRMDLFKKFSAGHDEDIAYGYEYEFDMTGPGLPVYCRFVNSACGAYGPQEVFSYLVHKKNAESAKGNHKCVSRINIILNSCFFVMDG